MEDAERHLELVDTEPESIDLELQDTEALEYTEALELVDIGILKDLTILHIRVTSLCHFSNITLTWHVQRCLEMQCNGRGAMEDPST